MKLLLMALLFAGGLRGEAYERQNPEVSSLYFQPNA